MTRKIRKLIKNEDLINIKRLYDAEKRVKEIAETLDFSTKTIIKTFKKIQDGFDEYLASFETQSQAKKKSKKNKDLVKATLCNHITNDNTLTQSSMVDKLNNDGFEVSQATVLRLLKDMQVTRKRLSLIPDRRNTPAAIQGRLEYAAMIRMINDNDLIFLDESD
ncbi:hypothetical protein BDAP_001843 [Binucleata daphniae]